MTPAQQKYGVTSNCTAHEGDIIAVMDGNGWIIGVINKTTADDREYEVIVGDSIIRGICGSVLVCRKGIDPPSFGKYIGHRFDSTDELRAAVASCKPLQPQEAK